MEIRQDSNSYKIHQNDAVQNCNQSKKFHYRTKLHLLGHSRVFLLNEKSNFFHPILNNGLSSEHVPRDFSILTILNPKKIIK